MFRKFCLLASFVLLTVMVSSTSGITVREGCNYWTKGDSGSSHWGKPLNWSLTHVPVEPEDAIINDPTKSAPIFDGTDTNADNVTFVIVGHEDGNGVLNIEGGTFSIVTGITLNDDKVSHPGKTLNRNTKGTLNMSDGTLRMGFTNPAWGYLDVGRYGPAVVNMTGGTMELNSLPIPARSTTAVNGVFNLNGGVVKTRQLNIMDTGTAHVPYGAPVGAQGKLKLRGGTLIIGGRANDPNRGNELVLINRYTNRPDANIIPYPETTGRAIVVADYNIRNPRRTTVTADQTTSLKQAYKPNPFNGHPYTSKSPTLEWKPGTDANDHSVYFGTASGVLELKAHLKGVDSNSYSGLGTLILGKKYYWKIDEEDASNNVTPGVEWNFTVGGKARYPSPEDGATLIIDADRNLKVSWAPGTYSAKHDVYYGTNYALVNGATDPNTPPGRGRQDANNYTPSKPAFNTTYYWKINEANSATPTLVVGDVWSFLMPNYLVEEDFESYADGTAMRLVWFVKTSGQSWTRDLLTNPVHVSTGSRQSMEIHYQLLKQTNEVYRFFATAQDWTEGATGGAKALTLWVIGQVYNDPVMKMFVRLQDSDLDDSATVYYPNPNSVVCDNVWTEINIDLAAFAVANFDLSKVKKISIGLDTIGDATITRRGNIYVDDIRLYPARCLSAENGPAGDINMDCVVNYKDVAAMGRDWLKGDETVTNSGKLYGSAHFEVGGGKFGNAVHLDGTDGCWVDIDDYSLTDFYDKTIAFWLKRNSIPATAATHAFGTASQEYRCLIKILPTTGNVIARIDFPTGPQTFEFPVGGTAIDANWHHIALKLWKNSSTGKVRGTLYVDGTGSADQPDSMYAHRGNLIGVNIGSLKDGDSEFGDVMIDDFRIYNTVWSIPTNPDYLTDPNIAKLADGDLGTNPPGTPLIWFAFNEGSGTTAANTGSVTTAYHPLVIGSAAGNLTSDSNIYDKEAANSRKVNFKDYAELAKVWLNVVPNWP